MVRTQPGLTHIAALYRGESEYLAVVEPFIRNGVDHGDAVLVVVPSAKLALLRDALGPLGESVSMSDMSEVGRNPARTFGEFQALSAQYAGRRIRLAAEPVWPGGRSAGEYAVCVQNEALWNTAFAERDSVTLCPYDADGLPETFLADARTTHPLIWQDGMEIPSADYSVEGAFTRYNEPLPVAPTAVRHSLRVIGDLGSTRVFAAQFADSVGLDAERVGDLQLIVSELATNSLKYTPGVCMVSLWQHDAELVCHVSDNGRLDDRLAGRRLPAVHATGGRGLYLVNALADLVRIHTSPAGTTVQAHLRLAPVAEPAR